MSAVPEDPPEWEDPLRYIHHQARADTAHTHTAVVRVRRRITI
ncbi:hypothetical protein SMD11_5444 [Streptomyces albireticuli]|uniref:Uncharacterized protein n=1 Tax=Streptomyces albireticuli TaxID=1940 RepID=A0A1Z2L9S1_9ACTN|nr:hypothetical protein SMD11_5444 [Streptomyces albireticuli]